MGRPNTLTVALAAVFLALTLTSAVSAQTPPDPPAQTPPPATFTPTVRVNGSLFTEYTYTFVPRVTDTSGREVSANAFNITRAYFTLNATVAPRISVRLTADAARETGPGTSFDGSLSLRIKYAFMQFDLTPWLGPASWTRFGVQHTPFIDAVETIYRYRFQGTLFTERDAGMRGADAGASLHVGLPGDHGDIHGGIYNGEGYRAVEANDQKSLQVRATYRPAPTSTNLKGWSVQFFINHDHYEADAPRRRVLASTYYQHHRFNAGLDVLSAVDQLTSTAARVAGHGYSMFFTPFFREKGHGPEALLRYDHFRTDNSNPAIRHRFIAGFAYWFAYDRPTTAAIMVDFEQLTTANAFPSLPKQQRLGVHGQIGF